MLKLNVLLCIGTALLFFTCTDKADHIPPTDTQTDLSVTCYNYYRDTATSQKVFEQTLYMWEEAFNELYAINPGSNFPLVVPADSLIMYLNPQSVCPNNCYNGFKAYLAQDAIPSTKPEVAENLCLILAPYTYVNGDMTDTVFPNAYGPFIRINPTTSGTEITYIDKDSAQNMINAWSAQYNSIADSIMVPISSFVIPKKTIEELTVEATDTAHDGQVYFTFGCHSIPPNSTEYCINNAKAYPNNTNVYGYVALNLMLSTKQPGKPLEHSEDFLRPCPRYCGNAMFSATF